MTKNRVYSKLCYKENSSMIDGLSLAAMQWLISPITCTILSTTCQSSALHSTLGTASHDALR